MPPTAVPLSNHLMHHCSGLVPNSYQAASCYSKKLLDLALAVNKVELVERAYLAS